MELANSPMFSEDGVSCGVIAQVIGSTIERVCVKAPHISETEAALGLDRPEQFDGKNSHAHFFVTRVAELEKIGYNSEGPTYRL